MDIPVIIGLFLIASFLAWMTWRLIKDRRGDGGF